MSSSTTRTARRSRRRLALWLGFGIVGLSMGAVWATGFATFTSGTGTPAVAAIVTPGSPTDAANALTGDVVADAPAVDGVPVDGIAWDVTWDGLWGLTPAYNFFTVTTPAQPSDATYNIAMLLSNGASLSASATWQTLQLKVWLVNANGHICNSVPGTVFPGLETDDSGVAIPVSGGVARVFTFDDYDSAVYWNNTTAAVANSTDDSLPAGIIAGQTYCIGVQASNPENDNTDGAENTDGTVLRATGVGQESPGDAATLTVDYPQFIATLNRAS